MATKSTKKDTKVVETEKVGVKATISDFDCIIEPLITEKSTSAQTEYNKVTFKVKSNANKTQIKNAVSRAYNVKVINVSVINVISKNTTRGSKYHGVIYGYKKAIV